MNSFLMKWKRTLAFVLAVLFVFRTPLTVLADTENETEEELEFLEDVPERQGGVATASDVIRGSEYTENLYWVLDGPELFITADPANVLSAPDGAVTGTLDHRQYYSPGELPWSDYTGAIRSVTVGGDDDIVVPYYTARWFSNLDNLVSVSFQGIDTSGTVNMAEMFCGCTLLETLDLSPLDTSAVQNMSGMFRDCDALELLELDNFDTSEVTDFSDMFRNCGRLSSLNVSMFNMSKGITMSYMFGGCKQLSSLRLGGFFCENAKDLSYVFSSCESLQSLDFSNACTAAAQTMEGMFENCASLTELDLSAFVTNKVRYLDGIFRGCSSLETVDLSDFKTPALRTASEMFRGCGSMESIDLSMLGTGSLTDVSGMFYGCESLTKVKMSKIVNLLEHKDLHDMFRGCSALTELKLRNETDTLPAENVIVIDGSGVDDMSGMFMDCSGLKTLEIHINMKNVQKVTDMLAGCTGLESFTKGIDCRLYGYKTAGSFANLPNPSADHVAGADGYWYTTVSGKEKRYTSDAIPDEETAVQYRASFGAVTYDPNGFDVDPVVDQMKYGEPYTIKGNVFGVGETLTHWTTEPNGGNIVNLNVTVDPTAAGLINRRLYAAWQTKPGATVNITWEKDNGEPAETETVQIGMMPEYTGKAPEKQPEGGRIYVFRGWSPEIEIATEDKTYWAVYEERAGGKISVTWDEDNGTAPATVQTEYGTVPEYQGTPVKTDPAGVYNYIFDHWEPAVTKAVADITYKAVYIKANKNSLYWGLENGTLTVSSTLQTGKAMSGNFMKSRIFTEESPAPWYGKRSQITKVVVGSAADTVKPEHLSCWFRDLEYAEEFDLTGLDASGAEDASRMFENCRRLKELDLSGIDTGKTEDFSFMLKNCSVLAKLNVSGLDTGSAVTMSGMFDGDLRLQSLDLSGFDTQYVTDFSNMFRDCRYMATLNVSGFNTGSALTMENMFSGCRSLTVLDVHSFNTAKAANLSGMFKNVALVRKLDLTGFAVDTAKTATEEMFLGMLYLDNIITGDIGDFTKASLPAPDGTRSEGAHGCWIGRDDVGHKPEELPVNKADNYRVLYAKVYYDPNGAAGTRKMDYMKSNAAIYGIKGSIYSAPDNKYFAGWTLNPEGTGTVYKAGQGLQKAAADELKGKTLYALWKDIVTPVATVVWRDADGEILRTDKNVPYGTIPEYGDTPPGKERDQQYSYSFKEWTPAIKPVDGNAEYSPTYNKTVNSYEVTWKNYDGTVLAGPVSVKYGNTVTYQGETPVRPSDGKYTYEFKGWSPEVGEIRGNTVYTAAFARTLIPTTRTHHVVFKNYDNVTVLQELDVEEGKIPTYTGEEPKQQADEIYTYKFTGWDPKIKAVYADTVHVAKFSRSLRDYLVTYDANGHGKTKTVRVYVGSQLTPPEDPEETGWVFQGWYTTRDLTEKVNFSTYIMPAHAVTFYAGWKQQTGGGGGGGGGGGSSVKSITVNQNLGGATFSPNWKQNAGGKWYITDSKNEILRNCWLCDDAVAVNRCEVWYLLQADGTMLDAGLVQDNTGNYYSLEMEHNGYYGRLRTQNGYYDGIWLEFEHSHNGSFGAIKNKSGIEALKEKYGVTAFNIGNENCVYSSAF